MFCVSFAASGGRFLTGCFRHWWWPWCCHISTSATPRLPASAVLANQHRRLQSVINAAARLIYQIYRRRRSDHECPLLRDLHWLKSPERVNFKLAVTVYRCLHGLAPLYLANSLKRVTDAGRRKLCSSSSDALTVPSTRQPELRFRVRIPSYDSEL